MKNPDLLRPPAHLKAPTKAWWRSVVAEFDLDQHHLRLLQLAAESWDRGADARRAIHKHGAVYQDRFGQPKTRPEVAIERDNKVVFARLLRELALDVEEPPGVARPVAVTSMRARPHRV